MTNTRKRNIGILSTIPLILLLGTLIYEDSILDGLFSTFYHHEANAAVTEHYSMLMILYTITAVASIAMLLYFIIHVASLKKMTAANKVLWISFLTLVLPVSFVVFWYMQIRSEPKAVETKPDIS